MTIGERLSAPDTNASHAPPRRTKLIGALKALFALAMFAGAVWVINGILRETNPRDILRALGATPAWAILVAAIATPLSYLSLAGSEWLALVIVGKKIPARRITLVTIVSYTMTNALGFSVATGAVARYRYYPSWGLSNVETAAVMIIAGIAVTLSGLVTAGVALLLTPLLQTWMYALGAGLAVLALLWLAPAPRQAPFLKRLPLHAPSFHGRLGALASGIADWLLSGLALYILIPDPDIAGFAPFIAIFVLGSVVSAASGVPGGIGVFEAVVLTLSTKLGANAGTAAALLLYRLVYAIVPFTLVALTLTAQVAHRRRRR